MRGGFEATVVTRYFAGKQFAGSIAWRGIVTARMWFLCAFLFYQLFCEIRRLQSFFIVFLGFVLRNITFYTGEN